MKHAQTREPEILAGLTEAERHAVRLVKATIDCFNGVGMMSGVERYGVLEGRLLICATAARKLTEFWGKLLVKMQWPAPPKRVDALILPLVATGDEHLERGVLKALREQPAMVIMLARYWREEEKGKEAADVSDLKDEWEGLLAGMEAAAGEETSNA